VNIVEQFEVVAEFARMCSNICTVALVTLGVHGGLNGEAEAFLLVIRVPGKMR